MRNTLVSDTGGHIKHDDGSLATNVITVTKSSKFFLSCTHTDTKLIFKIEPDVTSSIPAVENDRSQVGEEGKRVHFNTHGGHIFLLKLTSSVTLDEGSLARTTITNQNQFESGRAFRDVGHGFELVRFIDGDLGIGNLNLYY